MKVPPLNHADYLIKTAGKYQALGRKFVTSLDKSGAILPVVLLEATVTGGRTYQAYQRDGFVEARERVTEESLGAVFWLFGAKMFGNLFDKLGRKFLNIPKKMPDVGRDAVRTPFDNFIAHAADKLKLTPDKAEQIKKNLARYSVGKTAASIITACLFIGYVVPKLNQGITKHLFGRMNSADPNHEKAPDPLKNKITLKDARAILTAKDVSINAVENFKARKTLSSDMQKQNTSIPSFKAGADSLLRIVQNFEENDVWKLMGTDVGTVTGRTANARNKDERIEIMFRDISSIYFYCFSMPAIVKFMNNHDEFGGKNTKLNPMSAAQVHNYLVEEMHKKGVSEMSTELFSKFALGSGNVNEDFMTEAFGKAQKPINKKYLFGLIKKEQKPPMRIVSLERFKELVDVYYKNSSESEILKLTAEKMSELQPKKGGTSILTEIQVQDVFKGGVLRQPDFLKSVFNNILKDKNDASPITNKYKYISAEKLEDLRSQVYNYAESIITDAERNKTKVTWESMKKMNKRNMYRNGMFMALAMGVSSLFLSTIIPKIQYYITYLRTGKNSFPGTENLNQNK
ncbi:MAG: hypothetical protein KHX03_09045 [Clostridium sp.]|nr:hypothetical protein [Clostridium sp.]